MVVCCNINQYLALLILCNTPQFLNNTNKYIYMYNYIKFNQRRLLLCFMMCPTKSFLIMRYLVAFSTVSNTVNVLKKKNVNNFLSLFALAISGDNNF